MKVTIELEIPSADPEECLAMVRQVLAQDRIDYLVSEGVLGWVRMPDNPQQVVNYRVDATPSIANLRDALKAKTKKGNR
jgi:hypothetical protein